MPQADPFEHLSSVLGVNVLERSLSEYEADLVALFLSAETLVVLDTNVLLHAFELSKTARAGLYKLLEIPAEQDRLLIPAWCANEYFQHFGEANGNNGKRRNVQVQLENAIHGVEAIEETVRWALEPSEEPEEEEPLSAKLRAVATTLKELLAKVKHEYDQDAIRSEINGRLSNCVGKAGYGSIEKSFNERMAFRIASNLPPGRSDKTKASNAHGDLALWIELLDAVQMKKTRAGRLFENVLLLSNEKKNDWTYAPHKRRRFESNAHERNDRPVIRLADPRLVLEFEGIAGHRRVAIAPPERIVSGLLARPALDDAIHRDFEALGRVYQAEHSQPSKKTPTFITNEASTPSSGPAHGGSALVASTAVPFEDEIGARPISDELRYIEAQPPGAFTTVIQGLRSYNWYTQNDAVEYLQRTIEEEGHFSLGQLFVVGRNIYQAAVGNARSARSFMTTFHERFDTSGDAKAANAVLAGLACEIYFRPDGSLRLAPKARYSGTVFQHFRSGHWTNPALSLIRRLLEQFRAQFFWIPGDPEFPVEVAVDAYESEGETPKAIARSVSVAIPTPISARFELLAAEPRPDGFGLLGGTTFTVETLRQGLADKMLIPARLVSIRCAEALDVAHGFATAGQLALDFGSVAVPRLSQKNGQA